MLELLYFHERNRRKHLWFWGTFTWWYIASISPVTAICSSLNCSITSTICEIRSWRQCLVNWKLFHETLHLSLLKSPSETRKISKSQKMNEVNYPQISWINIWFLVNHTWQALKEHTRVRIAQKTTINQYQQI